MCFYTFVVLLAAIWSFNATQEALVTTSDTRPTVERGLAAIETVIVNNADVPLSAWKISVEYTLRDGTRGSRAITRDVFATVAGVERDGPSAPAYSTARELILIGGPPGTTVATATAKLEFAVFADGTWIGPESEVAFIFQQRQRELDAWATVAKAMEEGLKTGGAAGLRSALVALNRPDQRDMDHPVKNVMRRNIERAMKGQLPKGSDAGHFLRTWSNRSKTRAHAASEHVRQGGTRRSR